MTGPRLAIIADDLTGALDSAAPFAAISGGVLVATRPDSLGDALAASPGVVAVSTRSREIGAEAARERVARVLAGLPAGVRVFKKIDSRLKGNIAAELSAIGGPLLVLPAIPDFGRIVVDGSVQGFGTEDPVRVAAALSAAADRAEVPDCRNADDIARALAAADGNAVLVGARGLAMALAARWGLAPAGEAALPQPCCFVVGSRDPITRAQVALLARRPDVVQVMAQDGRVPPARPARIALICTDPDGTEPAGRIAARLAEGVHPWIGQAQGALLTGGATAEAVLDALDIACLRIEGEALPGMPLCRADGRSFVTKSGGFGAPDAFLRLAGLNTELEP